ncbi:uncharacterized protein VTP21DRAFT_4334 [Calcarisporiella thermophila]|uniref:uncharacterized protein n=1 Tax=Calcarisporiella thermophila TaxID=911321 RepID=UPI0037421A0C
MVATLPVGMSAALLLIPYLAPNSESIPFMLLTLTLIALTATLLTFFMPLRPQLEHTENPNDPAKRLPFRDGIKMIIRNRSFWLLVAIFSINMGLSTAFTTLMNQIISPHGYSDQSVGVIGFVMIGAGALGMLVTGPIVDRTGSHKTFLKVFAPLMAVSYIAFCWTIGPNSFCSILINIAFNGIATMVQVPITLELGAEFIEDKLRDPNGTPPNNLSAALTFQSFVSAVAGVLVFFYNAPNLRMKSEITENKIALRPDRIESIAKSEKIWSNGATMYA